MENNNQNQPYVIAVIGANGCGKTETMTGFEAEGFSALGRTFPIPTLWLNPDAIANEFLHIDDKDQRDTLAFNKARELRQAAMEAGETFAFESVASHTSRTAELQQLKARGYCIVLVFIGTDDPAKNVERVHFRFDNGTTTKHFVEDKKVIGRYHLLNRLMPLLAEVADVAFVMENSGHEPVLQVLIDDESFNVSEGHAQWIQTHLLDRLEERFLQRLQITNDLDVPHTSIYQPDVGSGTYEGWVVHKTKDFIVIKDVILGQYFAHDRLMLETDPKRQEFSSDAGDYLTITYDYRHSPLVVVRKP